MELEQRVRGRGRGIADNVAKCLRSLRSVKIFAQTLFGKLACYGFKVIYRPRGEIRRKEFVLQSVQTVEHTKNLTSPQSTLRGSLHLSNLESELREVFPA